MNGGVSSKEKYIRNVFDLPDPCKDWRTEILGDRGRSDESNNQQTFESTDSVQPDNTCLNDLNQEHSFANNDLVDNQISEDLPSRERVRSTEIDQCESLCKKRKIEAQNGPKYTKNVYNSTTKEDLGYVSDDSCENKGSLTNNSSNDPKQDCPDKKHNDNQALHDDPRHSFDNGNQIIFTESSDFDPKDENSSCSSSDYSFLKDSLLMKLEIPLTADEKELINKFCEEIKGITTQQEPEESILKSIECITDEYLKQGVRLNSSCSNDNKNDDEKGDKETVTSLILKEINDVLDSNNLTLCDETRARERQFDGIADQDDDNEDKVSDVIIKRITSSLVLKGGIEKGLLFYPELGKHYDYYYLGDLEKQYQDRKEELERIAYGGIVNKSNKQAHEYDFKAEIDNKYLYIKYPQDSIIEPAKIFNKAEDLKDKALNLKVGILQIGESIVRVKVTKDGKRNYTDVLKGSIEMSFITEVGEISIYLHPDEGDSNEIKVEIDEENKAKFNKLKDKSSLGENCLLGGKNVTEAIKDKSFERNKDVPSTDLTQPRFQQKEKTKEKQ